MPLPRVPVREPGSKTTVIPSTVICEKGSLAPGSGQLICSLQTCDLDLDRHAEGGLCPRPRQARKFDASMGAKWPGRGHAGTLASPVEGSEGGRPPLTGDFRDRGRGFNVLSVDRGEAGPDHARVVRLSPGGPNWPPPPGVAQRTGELLRRHGEVDRPRDPGLRSVSHHLAVGGMDPEVLVS